ncbi:MAG: 3-oxoacyl-ACP synthase [Candidatus Neomarinimicrobiota bacterium]|nr:ketoacyl-ACP synthase III [Candidatus Neomarinimicrobiota bacterium]RKY50849.1 MAG: 3-oxoacyl-ACP synthase [Candidatus Neomarinimicrobiota bacterium]
MGVKIAGYGYYVPEKVVTNHDMEKLMDTSDEWITERTGIKKRHFVTVGEEGTSDLAVKAAENALKKAGMTPADLDMIVAATLSPDYEIPGIGVLVQKKLDGCRIIPAYDIRQQCSGFVYGLELASTFIKSGKYKTILLVGAETQSVGLNLTTSGRDLAVLFGDGAGAFVLTASEEESDVVDSVLHSEGEYYQALWKEYPSIYVQDRISQEDIAQRRHYPSMNGRFVFKHATTRMPEVVMELLNKNGVCKDDIAQIIPHQANLRITRMVAKRLELTLDKVYSNIEMYGNTTAASIPIAFCEALNEKRFKRGDYVITVSFGSGFTWGANLIKF